MTKLLAIDLRESVPGPIATPLMTDRLYETHLNAGQIQVHQWVPVHVNLEDDRESPTGLTDFIRTVPFLMVSKRFRDLLNKFGSQCEFLPLVVRYNGKTMQDEYFALNALLLVSHALDMKQSVIGRYIEEASMARDVQKLVLKPDALGDTPLCYLSEISQYVVSDQLAHAIEKAGLMGIELMDPSDYSSI